MVRGCFLWLDSGTHSTGLRANIGKLLLEQMMDDSEALKVGIYLLYYLFLGKTCSKYA